MPDGDDTTAKSGGSVWDLVVFQRAYDAALDVHRLTQSFPRQEQYELTSQLRRSSKGICANLAEGRGRQQGSSAEFRRFILIALGSANETILWCRFALDLGYLTADQYARLEDTYNDIARMLSTLASRIR